MIIYYIRSSIRVKFNAKFVKGLFPSITGLNLDYKIKIDFLYNTTKVFHSLGEY